MQRIYPYYVVACLMLASALSYLDRLALSMLIEPVKADLALSDTQISLLAGTAFAATYVLFAFFFGRWVDRHGRRNAIVAGLALWSLATAACGLARNFGTLFAARSMIGVGEASLNPAGYSMIADYFTAGRRGLATAIFACGATLGGGLAIMLGGTLVDWVYATGATLPFLPGARGWQTVFVMIGLPGLLVAVLLLLTVREPGRRLAPTEADTIPGIADALRFARANARALAPLFAGYACTAVIGYSFMVWGPVHFMRLHGLSAGDVGMVLGIGFGVGGTIGLIGGGIIADRIVSRGRIDGPILVTLAAVALDAPLFIGAYLVGDVLLAALLFCLGMASASVVGGCQIAMVQSLAPNRLRGIMAALFGACVNLAGFGIAPALTAGLAQSLFGGEMGIGKALATMTALTGTGAILLILTGLRPGRDLATRLAGERP
ncbi:MFS transporter [Sphingobium jiangsuense]|uniref:MFS family permease n=1 Tax=Sphingobium jiangsuense TaxID=870476 RepID=A0A7W6FQG3_9SPHN|nr:MFS transporter [Sphingobium jiangsuense]MBB3926878.1 MFS family permease [Sphingobium jiangsuense]GLS98886.1 MFS transporter [Sphingobium jiangsuense]